MLRKPTKEKMIDDLHWSLEQWQEKKFNITPRTMKLLNLAGILNDKDLLETPLAFLQEIVTVKEGNTSDGTHQTCKNSETFESTGSREK
jgi:hypothetical protein